MRLALVLVLLSGCAAPPALTGPPVTRADLNAALFGQVVTLRLSDGSRIEDARAVIVTPDAVRFNDDRRAPMVVRSVPTAEVCEITRRVAPDDGDGILLGILPGLGALAILSRSEGALSGALGLIGFAATISGGVLGRQIARRRNPARHIVLYRSEC